MKNETAKEVLIRLYGDHETYEQYKVIDAMIEFAILRLELQHERALQILKGDLHE